MHLLLLSQDLMTRSRIESSALSLGCIVKCVATGEELLAQADEHTVVAIDLSSSLHKPADCVQQLRLLPQKPPAILAFGPHVHEQNLQLMVDAGCDGVYSRGQFLGQTANILRPFIHQR